MFRYSNRSHKIANPLIQEDNQRARRNAASITYRSDSMKSFDPSNKTGMQCDVNGIPGYKDEKFGRTIMPVEVYKQAVSDGGFIDWDGFGDQLGPKFGMLGSTKPSAISNLNPKCVWVVWYNR